MEGCFLQYYWLTFSIKLIKNYQHLKYFLECLLKVLWLITVKIRTGKQSTITTNLFCWHCCRTCGARLACNTITFHTVLVFHSTLVNTKTTQSKMVIFFTMRNNSYNISSNKKSLQNNKNASKKKKWQSHDHSKLSRISAKKKI